MDRDPAVWKLFQEPHNRVACRAVSKKWLAFPSATAPVVFDALIERRHMGGDHHVALSAECFGKHPAEVGRGRFPKLAQAFGKLWAIKMPEVIDLVVIRAFNASSLASTRLPVEPAPVTDYQTLH